MTAGLDLKKSRCKVRGRRQGKYGCSFVKEQRADEGNGAAISLNKQWRAEETSAEHGAAHGVLSQSLRVGSQAGVEQGQGRGAPERSRTGRVLLAVPRAIARSLPSVSYTHLRAHETDSYL
eukprot:1641932-Pleurochrysis_carterae.AAC.1